MNATVSTRVSDMIAARSDLRRGIGVILLSSMCFGVMAVFVRTAALEMPSTQVAFFRFFGAFLVLIPFTWREGIRPRGATMKRLLLRSVLGAVSITLYFRAIQDAGASLATLIHMSYPVHTTWMAAVFLGETITSRVLIALGLNVLGAIVALGPAANLSPQAWIGGLAALISCVLAGAAVTAARSLRASESALLITVYFMAVGALATAPSLAAGIPPMSTHLVLALIGVVLTSVGGQFLLHQGLGFSSAIQGSLAATTGVITTGLCDALVFGTVPPVTLYIAGGLMMAAVTLNARR